MSIASQVLPSGSQELHVLAVDDSLVDLTAVESGTRALQFLGLDGEKGSLGFNDLKVNLIMTDYSMPGMTGYELLKKIKQSSAFREISVVIMSSEDILTRIDRCLDEGAEDFLVKPVKLSDVKRLKDVITRGELDEMGVEKICKRKLEEYCHSPSSSASSPTSPLPSSPSTASAFACDLTASDLQSSSKRSKLHDGD